jgi:hypothetical protein
MTSVGANMRSQSSTKAALARSRARASAFGRNDRHLEVVVEGRTRTLYGNAQIILVNNSVNLIQAAATKCAARCDRGQVPHVRTCHTCGPLRSWASTCRAGHECCSVGRNDRHLEVVVEKQTLHLQDCWQEHSSCCYSSRFNGVAEAKRVLGVAVTEDAAEAFAPSSDGVGLTPPRLLTALPLFL